jgi:hypothetical protein
VREGSRGAVDEEMPGEGDERSYGVTEESEQRETMVHALREEPGSYIRSLKDGTQVIYEIRPLNGGFVAAWECATESGFSGRSHEEEFRTHADALRYLERNFDAPLGCQEGR